MSETAPQQWTYLDAGMNEPVQLALGSAGTAVVYSNRSPDKETANEDSVLVATSVGGGVLLVVADGMGGRPGGEEASKILIRELARAMRDVEPERLRAAVLDSAEAANRKLLDSGSGSATTLAAVEIGRGSKRPTARTYHVGDSQILIVGGRGSRKLQTIAHSPVGFGVEAGLIAESAALHHDERHLVSNIVGADDMRIEVGSARPLAVRDTVVIASDGLFDNLSVDEITERVRKGPLLAAGMRLIDLCRRRMAGQDETTPSKPDDLSFVLYRL